MIYIYSLSYNGKPFYIGQSKNPVTRYCSHLLGSTDEIFYFMFKRIVRGNYPRLSILDHTRNRKTANYKERDEVLKCAALGIRLINNSHNTPFNQLEVRKPKGCDRTKVKHPHFHTQAQKCFYDYVCKNKISDKPSGYIEKRLMLAAKSIKS